MMRYLCSVLLLLCSSCIQLGGNPQSMRYYLLESLPEAATITSEKILNINLQLVNFPEYLDHPQIVTQSQSNTVEFNDSERWAEPLQTNLMNVLCENLALLLPKAVITVSPWDRSMASAVKVELNVNKFSGRFGKATELDIRWAIKGTQDKVVRGRFTDRRTIGNNYQELVSGLNSGLEKLSRLLAKELAKE